MDEQVILHVNTDMRDLVRRDIEKHQVARGQLINCNFLRIAILIARGPWHPVTGFAVDKINQPTAIKPFGAGPTVTIGSAQALLRKSHQAAASIRSLRIEKLFDGQRRA